MSLSNLLIKLIFVSIIAYITGFLIHHSDSSLLFTLILLLSIPFVCFIIQQPFDYILKCMLFVLFFMPIHYVKFLNIFNIINPLTILATVLCFKILHEKFIQHKKSFNLTSIDYFYFMFIFSALISTLSAISIFGSLNWIFYSITTGYVVYKVITNLNPDSIIKVLKYLILLSSVCALYGFIEYFIIKKNIIYGFSGYNSRFVSLLGHPLYNGLVYSTILPISMASYFETKRKRFIFSSIILLFATILSFSRGSWLAFICGLITMIILCHNKIRLKLILIILFLLVILGSIAPLRQAVLNRINKNEADKFSSFNTRIKSIPIAFEIVKDKPFFGGGPFNASRYKDIYATNLSLRRSSFENTYLALLIDLGFVGLTLLLSIYFLSLKRSLFKKWSKNEYDIYRIATLSSLIILLINMGTFNFDGHRLFHFITWFYIGINVAISNLNYHGNQIFGSKRLILH